MNRCAYFKVLGQCENACLTGHVYSHVVQNVVNHALRYLSNLLHRCVCVRAMFALFMVSVCMIARCISSTSMLHLLVTTADCRGCYYKWIQYFGPCNGRLSKTIYLLANYAPSICVVIGNTGFMITRIDGFHIVGDTTTIRSSPGNVTLKLTNARTRSHCTALDRRIVS